MKNILISSIAAISIASGAAYKLPEQSLKGTALSAANVASCDGADCAYYNPANISFLDANSQFIEGGLTFVHLPKVSFKGKQTLPTHATVDATAETLVENVAIPYLHYVSKAYGDLRYSLSVSVPAGLTKRWDSPVQKLYAEEFTLKTVMINPSVAYKLGSNFSVAIGANIVYSEGKVYSDGGDIGLPLKREMKGDSIDYGYNLAASLHSDNGLNLTATYRSEIKLTEEGKANLYFGGVGRKYDASVSIYIPATLTLAISKDIDRWNLEFAYERTFWSSYKQLDFNYKQTIPSALNTFDKPIDKNWRDTDTFRFGLQYRYSDKLTLMAGYSYDESPVPEEYISYELPDSDAHIFSAGFKYKQNKNLSWGASVLYDYKTKRTVNSVTKGTKGKFSKGGALLITTGFEYNF